MQCSGMAQTPLPSHLSSRENFEENTLCPSSVAIGEYWIYSQAGQAEIEGEKIYAITVTIVVT